MFIAIHGVTGQPVVAGKLAGRIPADAQKLVIDGVFGLNLQAAAHIEDVLFGDGEFMSKPKGGFFQDVYKRQDIKSLSAYRVCMDYIAKTIAAACFPGKRHGGAKRIGKNKGSPVFEGMPCFLES